MNELINKIKELNIPPEDIEIRKEVYNGYYVIYSDKEKETEINDFIKKRYFERIIDKKVKKEFGTWGVFNENVEKSYRNKSQILDKLVSLSKLLHEIGIRIELKHS